MRQKVEFASRSRVVMLKLPLPYLQQIVSRSTERDEEIDSLGNVETHFAINCLEYDNPRLLEFGCVDPNWRETSKGAQPDTER